MPKKRYWLRGGISGLIFSSVVMAFYSLQPHGCIGLPEYPCPPYDLLNVLKTNILGMYQAQMSGYYLISIPELFIYPYIIGTTIGWIYGKIKNRKSNLSS